jgi:hypothetical protein
LHSDLYQVQWVPDDYSNGSAQVAGPEVGEHESDCPPWVVIGNIMDALRSWEGLHRSIVTWLRDSLATTLEDIASGMSTRVGRQETAILIRTGFVGASSSFAWSSFYQLPHIHLNVTMIALSLISLGRHLT